MDKHRFIILVGPSQTGYVCITPTGMDREEMTYHDVVVIDLDANVIEAETAQRRPN